jgi:hypothetical protein
MFRGMYPEHWGILRAGVPKRLAGHPGSGGEEPRQMTGGLH